MPTPCLPPSYFAPSYWAPSYWAGSSRPVPTIRDWDILDDIVARLKACGAFDGVHASDLPETRGRGADRKALAIVAPDSWDESEGWDDPDEPQWLRKVDWTLTVIARAEDPRSRDRHADRLLQAACVALDFKCLAGVTLPGLTKITAGRYLPAVPPTRAIRASGTFAYLIDGPDGHAIDP